MICFCYEEGNVFFNKQTDMKFIKWFEVKGLWVRINDKNNYLVFLYAFPLTVYWSNKVLITNVIRFVDSLNWQLTSKISSKVNT